MANARLPRAAVHVGFGAKLSSFCQSSLLVTSVADLLPFPGVCVFMPPVIYELFLGVI